jgi:hypothetical protein
MSEIEELAAQIQHLSPADKLRLAAGLLEKQRPRLAHQVAERVVLELGAALALDDLRKLPKKAPR